MEKKKLVVLLVEDEEFILKNLAEKLETGGKYFVVPCDSGKKVLDEYCFFAI